ncbi:MAG: CDP-alcohol phosphatidyltransferase family protein [Candidatus Bipolaricaulota bacterium]|nr:CDP-alcohol phosphatidyltransferase family protein [Candidatus Bipolaricaulota bacterium]
MTWATLLTLVRGGLLVPTVVSVLGGRWTAAFLLFLGALATDVLDGWVARRTRQVTLAGQLLDPAVDKLFYVGLFSALAAAGRVSPLAVGLFVLPQLGLGVGTLVLWGRRGEFAAEGPGKAAAGVTAAVAGVLLVAPRSGWVLWVAVGAQFTAALYYLVRRARGRTPVGAPPPTPPTLP